MRRLAALAAIWMVLLFCVTGTASAFMGSLLENRAEDFFEPVYSDAPDMPPQVVGLQRGNRVYLYESASGVGIFVNNNPFNAWDYLGLMDFYASGWGDDYIPHSFASDRRGSGLGGFSVDIDVSVNIDAGSWVQSELAKQRFSSSSVNVSQPSLDFSSISNVNTGSSPESIDQLFGLDGFDARKNWVPSTHIPRQRLSDAKTLEELDAFIGPSEAEIQAGVDYYHDQQAARLMREAMPMFIMDFGGSVGGSVSGRSFATTPGSIKVRAPSSRYKNVSPEAPLNSGGKASFEAKDFIRTDKMDRASFSKLMKKIRKQGLQDRKIQYVIIEGKPYVVNGSNRIRAARQLGIEDQLQFEEVQLPFRGYQTPDDVIQGAIDTNGGSLFY